MVIEQELDSLEQLQATREMSSSSFRRWFLVPFFVVAIGLPFIVPHSVAYILIFGLLFIAPIPLISRWGRRGVKKELAKLPKEQRFELDAKGIKQINRFNGDTVMKAWDAIAQIKETESFYFLAVHGPGLWIIKKQSLPHEKAEEVRSLFRNHVGVFREVSGRSVRQSSVSLP